MVSLNEKMELFYKYYFNALKNLILHVKNFLCYFSKYGVKFHLKLLNKHKSTGDRYFATNGYLNGKS